MDCRHGVAEAFRTIGDAADYRILRFLELLDRQSIETQQIEFGGDTRLVLSRDEIVELIRVFLPDNNKEVRLIDQIEKRINRVVKLIFVA